MTFNCSPVMPRVKPESILPWFFLFPGGEEGFSPLIRGNNARNLNSHISGEVTLWQRQHFKRNDSKYPMTSGQAQAFFEEKGWGDGLPIIPPTEARVAQMLAATKRKAR